MQQGNCNLLNKLWREKLGSPVPKNEAGLLKLKWTLPGRDISPFTNYKWMGLEDSKPNEMSQRETTPCDLTYIWNLKVFSKTELIDRTDQCSQKWEVGWVKQGNGLNGLKT